MPRERVERKSAEELEALDQERLENPYKTPPNSLTNLDKAGHSRPADATGSGAAEPLFDWGDQLRTADDEPAAPLQE